MDGIRKQIAQHSIEVQNEFYQKELEKLRKENEERESKIGEVIGKGKALDFEIIIKLIWRYLG